MDMCRWRVRQRRGESLSPIGCFTKALMLDPNNAEALHQESVLLAAAGRTKEALALRQRLQTLEPFVPLFVTNNADILWLNGQTEAGNRHADVATGQCATRPGPGQDLRICRTI
jgi:Flp pilus assembly protein TadD